MKFISEDILVGFSADDFAIMLCPYDKEMAGPAGLEPAAPGFGALHHLQYFLSSSFFACFFLLTVVV